MIKKLRVTVDGKAYDVMVEMSNEVESPADAATGAPSVPASPPKAAAPEPTPASPPKAAAPEPAPTPTPAKAGSGPGAVVSPLAGRIAAIVVAVGQDVKQNDHLLTIEAMKMNTFVFAPKDGKVAEINVAPGDAVTENQMLARIE